ncbi:hypothetical protein PMIN04_009155 [Paraphaeosphaeria minitans]
MQLGARFDFYQQVTSGDRDHHRVSCAGSMELAIMESNRARREWTSRQRLALSRTCLATRELSGGRCQTKNRRGVADSTEPDTTIATPSTGDAQACHHGVGLVRRPVACPSQVLPPLSLRRAVPTVPSHQTSNAPARPISVSISGPYTRKSSPGDWERSGMRRRDNSLP